jgi:flagellar biosynthesis component FlhA
VGKLVSLFFCLPIIALCVVIVPVLCAVKYFLLVIMALVTFRMGGWEEMESKEVKGKGKNKEVEKTKTKKQTKKVSKI